MSYELQIIRKDDWFHAIATGQNTIGNVEAYMSELSAACRAEDCSKLLIEERLDGPRLSTLEIFKVVSKQAEKVRGSVMSIAYVDLYAEGDLMTFAETVANNRGSRMSVFSTVADAEAWLQAQSDSQQRI